MVPTGYHPVMQFESVRLEIPDNANVIVGQTHFIKTVEDLYEAIVTAVPQMKFGVAFNEASGPCLTRVEGNDEMLRTVAARNATAIGAGHVFVVVPARRLPHQRARPHQGRPGGLLGLLCHRQSRRSRRGANRAGPWRHGRD